MNLYSNPGAFGLQVVGEADQGESYEWDTFIVYRDESSKLYYVHGAGCSCTYIGDTVESLADLTAATVQEVHEALDEWNNGNSPADVVELHAKLANIS